MSRALPGRPDPSNEQAGERGLIPYLAMPGRVSAGTHIQLSERLNGKHHAKERNGDFHLCLDTRSASHIFFFAREATTIWLFSLTSRSS